MCDDPDLSLVSTTELLAELDRRCDQMGCVMMQCGVGDKTTHLYRRAWKGNSHTVVGLLHDLQQHIYLQFTLQERSPNGEFE